MTHITIASTLREQPIAINGRTATLPTNRPVELAPVATKLQVEPDDICATLDAAHVSYTRFGAVQSLGAAQAGDEGGGAGPGGLSAPPVHPEARDDALHALVTGPADQIEGPAIEGETAPLVPGEAFPGSPPAPPAEPAKDAEPSLLDQSVPKLIEALANVTSTEIIDALIADETAGKTRATALDALAARKAEIEAIINQQG